MISTKIQKEFTLLLLLIIILSITGCKSFDAYSKNKQGMPQVRIGYFHGGRTSILFRAYLDNYFEKEFVNVSLITKSLNDKDFHTLQRVYTNEFNLNGKVNGEELIDMVVAGNLEGATVGESSFITAATHGLPIIAVAELGHDLKDQPGHAIIFNKNVKINTSSDIKGKTLATRRSGFGDEVFLREFLMNEGVDPKKDVKIIDDVPDDELNQGIINKTFDGAYYHLNALGYLVENNYAYIYRKMDWVNPELSQAVLIFRKDFAGKNPTSVEKIIRAYMKRIDFEHKLSLDERRSVAKDGFKKLFKKGLQIEIDYNGMNFPQYDPNPLVNSTLLNQMQDLLLKHGYIPEKINLNNFIDNSFVNLVSKELRTGI